MIIDDFLAHGEAAAGLANLVEQAGGTVCGIAAIIEKEFQGGSKNSEMPAIWWILWRSSPKWKTARFTSKTENHI